MKLNKPYSESCEQNKEPIRQVLDRFIDPCKTVLEIGSGTGQHAVYFAALYPHVIWQTSDLPENHTGIKAWIEGSDLDNVLPPLNFDVTKDWPDQQYDLIYTANTLHIMSATAAELCFQRVAKCMFDHSVLVTYGPFNYQGRYTSDSNARFDDWLKQRDPESCIKNFEWINDIAQAYGLICIDDIAMPANNRILAWKRGAVNSSSSET